MADFAPYNASLHPSFIVWVKGCGTDVYFVYTLWDECGTDVHFVVYVEQFWIYVSTLMIYVSTLIKFHLFLEMFGPLTAGERDNRVGSKPPPYYPPSSTYPLHSSSELN